MSNPYKRVTDRVGVLLAVMSLVAILGVAPLSAITNGDVDNGDHPYVGSMVLSIPDGSPQAGLHQWCSGTLLEDGWFLTASHCLVGVDSVLNSFPGSSMLVTFDPEISQGDTFYDASNYTMHPAFGVPGRSDTHDVGLIKLEGVGSVPTANLPSQGLLDVLKADHALKNTTFTAVGYGTVRDNQLGAFASIFDNLERNQADQGFHSLTKAWLNLPMTAATGDGGTCYGDSGGPHFVWIDGVETDMVASITVTGDAPCKALDTTYRMDTEATLDWLDGVMNP